MGLTDTGGLQAELDGLAVLSDSFPKGVIHRDFQSQNIMVLPSMDIRIIDFQGARIGPPAYDVASLLWDPYYRLDAGVRGELLSLYVSLAKERQETFQEELFFDSLLCCRLQRHMQALGAYGFLSSSKGKDYFLKYVPEGLYLLKSDIDENSGKYPLLDGLVGQLMRKLPMVQACS
jgi:aminoglycoside/choline kinase family phosphotransferase